MNNFSSTVWRVVLAVGCFAALPAQAQYSLEPPDSNMVMLPASIPLDSSPAPARVAPTPVPPASTENMVMVPMEYNAATGTKDYVPVTGPNYVETGVNYHSASNNVGDWFGQFVKGEYQTDPWNRWNATIQHQEAFHDQGMYFGVGNTHTFNEDWYSDVGVGFGTDAVFLNRLRLDALLNRRWLPKRNLITTIGYSHYRSESPYRGNGLLASVSYYFDAPWIVQAGIRGDIGDPGSLFGYSAYAALTHGYYKRYFITGRVGWGREAYQIVGNSVDTEFNSQTLGLNWRQWLGDDWGYNLAGEYYHQPAYHRTGGVVSVFKEF